VDGSEEWVITEILNQRNHTPRIRILVQKTSDHMDTYLTVGKEYVLRQGMRLDDEEHHVWIVPDKQCKRTTSQVLLYDFKNGPGIEIDS
jgi:hypothetical protein